MSFRFFKSSAAKPFIFDFCINRFTRYIYWELTPADVFNDLKCYPLCCPFVLFIVRYISWSIFLCFGLLFFVSVRHSVWIHLLPLHIFVFCLNMDGKYICLCRGLFVIFWFCLRFFNYLLCVTRYEMNVDTSRTFYLNILRLLLLPLFSFIPF